MSTNLPTNGALANRRYHLHRSLRRWGFTVKVKQRTICSQTQPTGKALAWCRELEKYSYHVQLTM